MSRRRRRSSKKQKNAEENVQDFTLISSRVFTCIDALDDLSTYFHLVNMALGELESEDDLAPFLLLDCFLNQTEPRLEDLKESLFSIFRDLRESRPS